MTRTLRDEIRQARPFAALEQEVYLNLVRTAACLEDAEARLMKEYGLSRPLYNVLRILRGAGPDGCSCQGIGGRMVTRVPDVTRLIDRLETQGLVARERKAGDRRVVRVRILDKGSRLLRKLDEPVAALHRDQLGHLDSDRLCRLNELLVEARGAGT